MKCTAVGPGQNNTDLKRKLYRMEGISIKTGKQMKNKNIYFSKDIVKVQNSTDKKSAF